MTNSISDSQTVVVNLVSRYFTSFTNRNHYDEGWVGTTTELYQKINAIAGKNQKLNIPGSPAVLSREINKISASCWKKNGIKVTRIAHGKINFIKIEKR